MAESNTRFFRDQRYPDQLISLEQLKQEYGRRVADGNIDPAEQNFPQYLNNCMESQGGTLSEVLVTPEKKGIYPFMIRETFALNVFVEADSFDEAQEVVEKQYGNGEFDLDRNCFVGAEFRPCCSKCESDYDEDDNDLREINEGTPMAMMLCNRCVADMEDCGTLTRCECCGDLFSPERLKINPENGLQEICPLCGEVWCE